MPPKKTRKATKEPRGGEASAGEEPPAKILRTENDKSMMPPLAPSPTPTFVPTKTMTKVAELLDKYHQKPLKALWKALHDKHTPGPELALAIAKDPRCGLGRRWDSSNFKEYNRSPILSRGATPLHFAACACRSDVVAALLAAGADAGAKDMHKTTALHFAASNGDFESVQALLASGKAGANEVDTAKKSPLDYAAANSHLNVVGILYLHLFSLPDRSPLHDAALDGNIPTLKALLTIGADVAVVDKEDRTPLDHAASHGDVKGIRLLFDNGADVNRGKDRSWTPLLSGVYGFNVEVKKVEAVRELLVNGASPTAMLGENALHLAASRGSTTLVKLLADYGVPIDAQAALSDDTPLHIAARNNCEMVEALLSKGANPELRDSYGMTPLQAAVSKGEGGGGALAFIKGGADVSVIYEEDGMSLLHVAATKGYTDVIKALLDAKADKEARCRKYGGTPLHYAVECYNLGAVQALIRKGADANARDLRGRTPLHLVVGNAYGCYLRNSSTHAAQMVAVLAQEGASVDAQDVDGNTPLHIAAARCHPEAVEALVAKGAETMLKNKNGSFPKDLFRNASARYIVDNKIRDAIWSSLLKW